MAMSDQGKSPAADRWPTKAAQRHAPMQRSHDARSAPTAQIDIVPGAGHYVMVEQPQIVNQHIAAFVAQLARSG